MSELREAAQAVLNDYERGVSIVVTERVIARLRAALAQPEAGPVAWIHAVRSGNGVTKRVLSFSAQPFPLGMALDLPGSIETISVWPLYTHPPRDKWREAVHDELVTTWTFTDKNKDDPPTESPIATKCQRIEGSGEICGLTPPCPDCGSALIDVPEGS